MRSNPPARMPQAFTYKDAEDVIEHAGRNGNLGANTTIRRDGDDIVIRLYSTDIIRYHSGGAVTLNSGGHQTTTTKGRINGFLSPYIHVAQVKGEWYVSHGQFLEDTPFYDGITIHPDSTVVREQERVRRNPRREKLIKGVGTGIGTLVTEEVWKKIDGGRIKEFPEYSTVGGYQLYYVIGEPGRAGEYDNLATVSAKTINSGQLGSDDVVVDVDINYEDDEMYDEINGEKIPAAYK